MNFSKKTIFLFLLLLLPLVTFSSRIMVMTALSTKSTLLMLDYLAQQLALHGHEIVHVTKEEINQHPVENLSYLYLNPNITFDDDVFMKNLFQHSSEMSFPWMWLQYAELIITTCEPLYSDEQDLRKKFEDSGAFDLILVDFYAQDCLYPLIHTKNSPVILIHANVIDPEIANTLSIPTPYYSRNIFTPPVREMNFLSRLTLATIHFTYLLIQEWFVFPKIEAFVSKHISDSPPITEIIKETSLVMAADDGILMDSRPIMPFVVDIACISCRPPKPLPPQIEQVIQDSAEHGFIIFAMGTFIKSSAMTQEMLDVFLKAFAKLKQTIVWQFNRKIENLPGNVKTFDWLPNQDLLGHPKCRLFIYHGGMYSSYEAIYHGVPTVGLGVFGDQMANIQRGVQKGITVALDKHNLTTDSIYKAINTAMEPNYTTRVKELSLLLKDQPTTPLERALFWIDYVIRHKGSQHLHVTNNPSFFEYFSLDMFVSCLIGIVIASSSLFIFIKEFVFPILHYMIFHAVHKWIV